MNRLTIVFEPRFHCATDIGKSELICIQPYGSRSRGQLFAESLVLGIDMLPTGQRIRCGLARIEPISNLANGFFRIAVMKGDILAGNIGQGFLIAISITI
jgi:hypothetical protein